MNSTHTPKSDDYIASGNTELDQDYSISYQSTSRVLSSKKGHYMLNLSYMWEIGAIIYYDGRVNFKGMIAVKSKHMTTYHFKGDAGINEQNLERGDLVVFSTNNGVVENLFALRHVDNFPWSTILNHVDFYKDIEFNYLDMCVR